MVDATSPGELVEEIPATPRELSLIPSRKELDVLVEMANGAAQSRLPLPPNCSTPQAILMKFLYAREVGISPMVGLYEIDLIEGKAAMNARTQVAMIRRRGLGEIRLIESADTQAIVEAYRADRPDERHQFAFTKADAERADLWRRKNWQKYPRAMLLARAQTMAARALFQEAFLGIAYTSEELDLDSGPDRPVEFVDTMSQGGFSMKKSETPPITVDEAQNLEATVEKAKVMQPLDDVPEPQANPEWAVSNSKEGSLGAFTAPDKTTELEEEAYRFRIKQLIGEVLQLPATQWKTIQAKWKPADRRMTLDELQRLANFFQMIATLRWMRDELSIPEDKWRVALKKRGVELDIELSEEAAVELSNKLGQTLTPFKKAEFSRRLAAKLGCKEVKPEGTIAGNG